MQFVVLGIVIIAIIHWWYIILPILALGIGLVIYLPYAENEKEKRRFQADEDARNSLRRTERQTDEATHNSLMRVERQVDEVEEEEDSLQAQSELASKDIIGKTCPYCMSVIKPNVEVVVCSACEVPHHKECWEENGNKCTTYGCGCGGRL